jgi:tetratricopeptide (TPR) repeat protein
MQAKILGQYDKALMYSDEILEMFVELYGNDYNPEIALALKQRGTIFDDMGELDKALELYFSGLEMYSHFHPDDEYGKSTYHADIGHVYSKLARVDPSKITEAENYMKRALAPLEERDGAMDSQVIKMKYNMGMMYLQMEQIGDARQYLLDALDAQKIIYKANPYHEDIGNSTQYIGACYAQEDDHENALKYYEEALAIFRKTYEFSGSDNHKHMFELFTNSSISYMQVGNRAKALEYVTAAFNIANNIYSENSIDMAGAYENMGMLRYILGIERKAALENFERSMKISLMYYPPNHPQITAIQEVVDELRTMVLREDNIASEAKAYTDIAKESLSLENLSKALECFEKSLLLYESQHGEIHPTIAVTCNEIGFIHDRLKNTEEAFRYYNRALSVCESSSDGKNPFKATLCGNIGGIHHEKGSFVEALKWYHKSLELFESIRGNNHVDTANTYFTIARCHDDAVSDIDTIVSWFLKAKDAYSSVFGEGSSQVKAMYHAISNVYKRAGDNEKAQEYAQLSR